MDKTTKEYLEQMSNETLFEAIDYFIDKIDCQTDEVKKCMMPKFYELSDELKRRGL